MKSVLLILLMFVVSPLHGQAPLQTNLDPSGPAALKLVGPSESPVKNVVTIVVSGLPGVDLTQTVGDQTLWIDTIRFAVSAPENASVELEKELSLCVSPWAWKLRVSFTPEVEGTYLLVCDWNEDPLGLAIHRVNVRGPPQPPLPPVPPGPDPPQPPPTVETTGVAYLVIIRPDQTTADQAKDLVTLRAWIDSQPSNKVEMLDFTRDQQDSSGGLDRRIQGYLELVPEGEDLPFVFLVQGKVGGGNHVHWKGELQNNVDAIIEKAKGVIQ